MKADSLRVKVDILASKGGGPCEYWSISLLIKVDTLAEKSMIALRTEVDMLANRGGYPCE